MTPHTGRGRTSEGIGLENIVADALSRVPVRIADSEMDLCNVVYVIREVPILRINVRNETEDDIQLQDLIQVNLSGEPDSNLQMQTTYKTFVILVMKFLKLTE